MITITNAQIYSISGEMAYQIDYNDGTVIRVVEGQGIIRNEVKSGNEWIQSGKPYKVAHSKSRQAERVKSLVIEFLS